MEEVFEMIFSDEHNRDALLQAYRDMKKEEEITFLEHWFQD